MNLAFKCFIFLLQLSLIFAFCYIRFYQHHELSEVSCTLISVVALFITFLTTILVPVDVFLASFMKSSDGVFKVRILNSIVVLEIYTFIKRYIYNYL